MNHVGPLSARKANPAGWNSFEDERIERPTELENRDGERPLVETEQLQQRSKISRGAELGARIVQENRQRGYRLVYEGKTGRRRFVAGIDQNPKSAA